MSAYAILRNALCLTFLNWGSAYSQVHESNLLVTVNQERSTIKATVYSGERKPEAELEKQYCWYAYRKIIQTTGGYEGKLLHGPYVEFYLNDQLLAKGEFLFGLKHKEWKYWYPDGSLKEIINWKRGVKHGDYVLHNDYGKILAKGRFKNNKLHARFYTYSMDGKIISRKRYRNGNEVLEKVKSEENTKPKRKLNMDKREKKKWWKNLWIRKTEAPKKGSETQETKLSIK